MNVIELSFFDNFSYKLKVFFDIFSLLLNIKPDILHLVTIQPIIMGGIAAKILGAKRVVYAISGLGHAFLSETYSFFDIRV